MVRARELIAVAALALIVLGLVMVSSASMWVSPVALDGGSPETGIAGDAITLTGVLTGRPAIYAGLAVIAFAVAAFLPMRLLIDRFEGKHTATFGGSVVALAGVALVSCAVIASVYLPVVGKAVNGSHRWINVPVLGQAQPSEFIKWGMVLVIAAYAAAIRDRLRFLFAGLTPPLVLLGLVCGLIAIEDLGTGVLIAAVGTLVLVSAGARLWQLALPAVVGLAGVVVLIIDSSYRVRRLTSFLNPFEDPQGAGYHMIQSMATIAGGGPAGRGLGHGLQKFGYLPEDTTDFLFAVICEEMGVVGALVVASLYALLIGSIVCVARRAPWMFARLVAFGVAATIALQATINLFVVTGLGPTKGIALPLLSAGGTGWVLTAFMLGLVFALDRATDAEIGVPVIDGGRRAKTAPEPTPA
ncbi:MAG: FtsW/RodA/SpoVE family cell cycle protein [Planctomycetota bacterium]